LQALSGALELLRLELLAARDSDGSSDVIRRSIEDAAAAAQPAALLGIAEAGSNGGASDRIVKLSSTLVRNAPEVASSSSSAWAGSLADLCDDVLNTTSSGAIGSSDSKELGDPSKPSDEEHRSFAERALIEVQVRHEAEPPGYPSHPPFSHFFALNTSLFDLIRSYCTLPPSLHSSGHSQEARDIVRGLAGRRQESDERAREAVTELLHALRETRRCVAPIYEALCRAMPVESTVAAIPERARVIADEVVGPAVKGLLDSSTGLEGLPG